jgi:hypothetical protein
MTEAEKLLKNFVKIEPIVVHLNAYTVSCLACNAYAADIPVTHKKSCSWKQALSYFKKLK